MDRLFEDKIVLNVWIDLEDGFEKKELGFDREELVNVFMELMTEMDNRNIKISPTINLNLE